MPSKKTDVIRHLFFQRFNEKTAELSADLVTFSDIRRAIGETGANLSTANLANFWKDLTRQNPGRSWPPEVQAAGFAAVDAAGDGEGGVFRFVPLLKGEQVPFPAPLTPAPALLKQALVVQSLSMPVATKGLGRRDESWLAQVSNRLNVVEAHFARFSRREVTEITFLQTGIKLRVGEIDAAYAVEESNASYLLSVEAKGRSEQIWPPQVLRAARALSETTVGRENDGVIPFAIHVVEPSIIHTIEFEPVSTELEGGLVESSQGVIQLVPPVKGID